ncbi:MAG TPA: phosphatase PAP2 family protein [Methylophilaceae bacterium]|nr:phosphatase PAP2 family protein [Methylophilaceae bacterium]
MPHKIGLYLNRMNQLDYDLCIRVNHTSQYRWVRYWFRLVSRLGDGMFWYLIMLGILLTQGQSGFVPVAHMALVGIASTIIYKWLKGKTLRPRPYEVHQDIWLSATPLDRFSFPSGHTLHAVAFCSVALVYYPVLASWLLLPFTVMVAMSRVVLGLHYPSDVIAGAMIGILVASISLLI